MYGNESDPCYPPDTRFCHQWTPADHAWGQIGDALDAIDRPESEFFHFPFVAVDGMTGAIPPGDVWYICAYSGNGKTAFISSVIDRLLIQGKRIYVMPLESQPNVFRTHLACKRIGIHAGMLLTGQYRREMDGPLYKALRDQVSVELMAQQHGGMSERLFVSPVQEVTAAALDRAMTHAAELQADVFVIDHIDHVGDEEHADRVRIQNKLLRGTQRYGLHTVVTSQLNNDVVRGDRLSVYQPPQAHHVYGGGKKRQIAAGMLGLFRPIRFDHPSHDELIQVRAGMLEPSRVLEPHCMGIVDMKNRHFGEREWNRVYLRVENGCVSD